MALDRESIFREQEKLRLLNKQLQAQVTALQNNPAQTGGKLENNRPLNLLVLDELIQKRIMEAMSLDHPTPITKIHDSPLSEEIQGCEFPRKFSTPSFEYYFRVSDPIQHI